MRKVKREEMMMKEKEKRRRREEKKKKKKKKRKGEKEEKNLHKQCQYFPLRICQIRDVKHRQMIRQLQDNCKTSLKVRLDSERQLD